MLEVCAAALRNAALSVRPVRRWASNYHVTGVEGQPGRAQEAFTFYSCRASVNGKRILEIGPGRMLGVLALARAAGAADCIAVDITRYCGVEEARSQGIDYRIYDGIALPCPNETVDLVWANYVLQHVRYPALTVREIQRVLVPGGLLICRVDLRDHYHMFEPGRQYECLAYSEAVWRLMTWNRGSYVNRLRFSEWQRLLSETDLEPIWLQPHQDAALLEQNRALAYLSHCSDEDILTRQFDAVCIKRTR